MRPPLVTDVIVTDYPYKRQPLIHGKIYVMIKDFPALADVLSQLPPDVRAKDILVDDNAGETVLAAETLIATALQQNIPLSQAFADDLRAYLEADPAVADIERDKVLRNLPGDK